MRIYHALHRDPFLGTAIVFGDIIHGVGSGLLVIFQMLPACAYKQPENGRFRLASTACSSVRIVYWRRRVMLRRERLQRHDRLIGVCDLGP